MADLGLSIGAKISEYLVEPLLIRPLRPIFCFKRFVDDFKKEHKKLSRAHVRVKKKVKVAKNNALEIYKDVNEWLEEVNAVMKDARSLQKKLEENKSCCFSIGWTCHYRLSKEACKITESIKNLSEIATSLDPVAHTIDLCQHIELSSSEESMVLNNPHSAFQNIMEALMKKDVNKVGLYGMGGVMKKPLVKLVCKEAKRLKMFKRTVLVNVPTDHTADAVMSIQGIIADHVDLRIKQMETKEGRSTLLRKRLTSREKILIILDKVRKEFDLDTVGIPSSGRCKVLLITPDLRVCERMQTHRNIQLGDLYEDGGTGRFKTLFRAADQETKVDANIVFINVLTIVSVYLLLVFQPSVAWLFVFIFLLFIILFYVRIYGLRLHLVHCNERE